MDRNPYVINVFNSEQQEKFLSTMAEMGILASEEYHYRKYPYNELYIIDLANKTFRRIDKSDDTRAMIHTGIRVIWVDDFIKEVATCSKPERVWKKIYRQDGTLAYEGFTENGMPHGAGKAYFPDGGTYQEGIFGEKGLLSGVEYYDNGQVRFDGILKYHYHYGPNYPVYGRCYYRDGRLMHDGQFKIKFVGSLGYPTVDEPKDYGTIAPGDRPRY